MHWDGDTGLKIWKRSFSQNDNGKHSIPGRENCLKKKKKVVGKEPGQPDWGVFRSKVKKEEGEEVTDTGLGGPL